MSCPQSGKGKGSSADYRSNRSHLPLGYRNQMAMVKHIPASQTSSRPSWSVSPVFSSPESDNSCTGNLHGAIGGHRHSSRSSSVSSGGSMTDGSIDSVHTQNKLGGVTADQCDSQQFLMSAVAHDKIDFFPSARDLNFSQLFAESETGTRVSPDQLRTKLDSINYIGRQNTVDASKQSRPIINNQNDTNNSTSSSQKMPLGSDFHNLFSDQIFSPSHFVAGINQEMQQMGYVGYSNISMNVPSSSADADLGMSDTGYQSAFSASFDRGQFSDGTGQSGFNGNGQYSANLFGRNQEVNNKHNGGVHYYSSLGVATIPAGNSTASYRPVNPNSTDYQAQSSSCQPFSSQDFSLPPPPAQSCCGNGSVMPEAVRKKVTCRLCNKNHKWAHVLECLHVYCFPCLTSKFDPVDKSIVCPECSRKTALKDGPCSLKLDYQTARFMREVNVCPFNCTACTRDKEAVICCQTCVAYLCSDCKDGHRSMNQFQNHILSPITKTGRTANGEYTTFCDKHPSEPMTKYCCVCVHMICNLCISEHTHPDYPSNINGCPTLEEVYPIVVERLNKWNEDALIKTKDMTEMSKQTPLNVQHVHSKVRNCRKQIDEYSDYCYTVVDQNRLGAHELLNKTLTQMEKDSLVWTTLASEITKELETVSVFNSGAVKCCSYSETMGLLNLMENAYKKSVEDYSSIIKNNESIKIDLKFDPNYKESHAVLNQNFLSISYSINGIEHKALPSAENDSAIGRKDFTVSKPENNDCNYQRWSSAPDSMTISTWNHVSERKTGTFIPQLNRCRTKTSYIHMFGEYGQREYAFTEPSGQAYLKDGSYVICDTNNHRIIYYNANHEHVRTIGQPPNIPTTTVEQEQRGDGSRGKSAARYDGCLYFPNRVAICPITQNIIATERPPSHDIQIFTIAGEFLRCFGGNILQHPRGVTVDEEGIIIVVECKVMKLVMFNQDGSFIMSHSLAKDLEFPNDVAAKDGKIFISDNRGHCVQVFNYNAEHLYKIGNENITFFPIGVSINHLNQVVVTDNHNTFNITVFDVSGTVLHMFESVSKLAQCHNVAVHPTALELMLTTKDCSVYFFNYDPDVTHPTTPQPNRLSNQSGMGNMAARRPRGSVNGNPIGSSHY